MESPIQFAWVAHEHIYRQRSSDWFWAIGLLSISLAVASVIFDNVLFAILILIAAFTLMLYAARKPQVHTYEITAKGVVAHTSLYPYENLHSFWIHEEYHPKKLILRSKRSVLPHITIPLGETDGAHVRQALHQKLKEEKHDPSLLEVLADYLEIYL